MLTCHRFACHLLTFWTHQRMQFNTQPLFWLQSGPAESAVFQYVVLRRTPLSFLVMAHRLDLRSVPCFRLYLLFIFWSFIRGRIQTSGGPAGPTVHPSCPPLLHFRWASDTSLCTLRWCRRAGDRSPPEKQCNTIQFNPILVQFDPRISWNSWLWRHSWQVSKH